MLKVQFDRPTSLDRPEVTYFTTTSIGDVVNGILLVTLESAMNMKGIAVSIKGKGQVRWSEGSGDSKRDYSAYETYLNEKIPFIQSENEMTLQPGTYEYPFECFLPPNLPSTFQGLRGFVKYYVKANIIRTGLKFNVTEYFPFTVVQKLNLDSESGEFKEPFEHSEESEVKCCEGCFTCLCWSIGTVSANYTLNRRCFVPGETIYISGEIVNNMSRDMKCKFSVIQRVYYHAYEGKMTYNTEEIVSVEQDIVAPGQTDVWTNVPLLIPAIPPSRLDGCKIMDNKYLMRCYADVSLSYWYHEAEIIIGTEPLGSAGDAPPITLQPTAVQF